MELPRLTGYLRVYSAVAESEEEEQQTNVTQQLAKKRRLHNKENTANSLSWPVLSNLLVKHAADINKGTVNHACKDLLNAARQIGM